MTVAMVTALDAPVEQEQGNQVWWHAHVIAQVEVKGKAQLLREKRT